MPSTSNYRLPLIVMGLGNGKRFRSTRHNIGSDTVDYLVEHYKLSYHKNKKLHYAECDLFSRKIIFLKSDHGINVSGVALNAGLKQFFPEPYTKENVINNILILHDDFETEFGLQKYILTGGHKGHNGVRNLIQILGGSNIRRIKLGIGRPLPHVDTAEFVIQKFCKMEESKLGTVKENARLLFENILKD
mmetsp:Transcript_89772/g.134548  ORF Transcript_89772/g.134548 Transcript_89772/m.134548 type:complete len:190 (+) Transcript_89772:29-598(+)